MEQEQNRLEHEVTGWRNREQRLVKMFGPSVLENRRFQKEKLAHFEVIDLKFKGAMSLDERLALSEIRRQRKELERQLYPGTLTRILYRTAKLLLDNRTYIRYQKATDTNRGELKRQLEAKGFGSILQKVDQQMSQGYKEISIPVTFYVKKGDRMDYQIELKRNDLGSYELKDLKASLKSEHADYPRGSISLLSSGLETVTANQAYNLLSGRSVHTGEDWLQLDFNDKDATGSFRTKVFPPGFGYDIEKELSNLKLKEAQDPVKMHELVAGLKNGDKMQATAIGRSKQIELEPNAHKKTVLSLGNNYQVEQKDRGTKVIAFKAQQKTQKTGRGAKV